MRTLLSRDVAYRSEAVYVVRCLLFYRVLALHVEFAGHLVAIVALKIFIQGLVVAGYAAAYARGMRRKHRGDSRKVLLNV